MDSEQLAETSNCMSNTQVNDLKTCGKTSDTVAWTKTLKRTFEKMTFYQGLIGHLRINTSNIATWFALAMNNISTWVAWLSK